MTSETEAEATPDAYEELLDRYERVANLANAQGLLRWDQEVIMPSGGQPARAKQMSTLSSVHHEALTDDAVGRALDDLEGSDLTDERAAAAREVRRQYDRATSVDADLVEEISETASNGFAAWREAKESDDFESFAPHLERLVELKREYAAQIDPDRDPYEVLFEEYEPYLGIDAAERTLERLREELVPLVDDVSDSDVTLPRPFEGSFPEDTQEALARDALDALGYDWERGRLDTAPHPFSSGTQFDARVTTRFKEDDPLDGLTATVHEFGHASYTLGLPRDAYGTPLGESRNLVVHESQSRFWENHVGRTRAFWQLFLPRVRERLGLPELSVDGAYAAANRVYDDNLIRVEADELTYHMHVVLRFEIERDLVRGDLDVADVPAVWNEKMEEYLGVRPDTDAEGCLQDVHWSHGDFGYFPTYSLGSVLAAQLDAHLREEVGDVDALVRDGEFDPIHDWLTENVRRHGRRYTTDDLVREATGEPFTADHFLDYVTGKYGSLYDL